MSTVPSYLGRRWHLLEIHDQEWCPDFIRKCTVETLQLGWATFPIPALALTHRVRFLLKQLAAEQGADTIIDLCSGGGGPIPVALGNDTQLKVVLTDLFPQPAQWMRLARQMRSKNIFFCADSVDATYVNVDNVLKALPNSASAGPRKGKPVVRTCCGAMHHFKPALITSMLASAAQNGDSVVFFEPLERTASLLMLYTVVVPLLMVLSVPILILQMLFATHPPPLNAEWIKNLAVRIFFTFCIPLLPVLFWFDGMVSALRAYSEPEWRECCAAADPGRTYEWSMRRESGPAGIGALVIYEFKPKSGGVQQ